MIINIPNLKVSSELFRKFLFSYYLHSTFDSPKVTKILLVIK